MGVAVLRRNIKPSPPEVICYDTTLRKVFPSANSLLLLIALRHTKYLVRAARRLWVCSSRARLGIRGGRVSDNLVAAANGFLLSVPLWKSRSLFRRASVLRCWNSRTRLVILDGTGPGNLFNLLSELGLVPLEELS